MSRVLFVQPGAAGSGFEPLMLARAQEMIRVAEAFGCRVMPVGVDDAASPGEELRRAAARFSPDFVWMTNLNYYLNARAVPGNLLAHLDCPVVAGWDDPLGALHQQFRRGQKHAGRAARNGSPGLAGRLRWRLNQALQLPQPDGCRILERFRETMSAPGLHHFAWDSGHRRTVVSLGLAPADRIHWYPLATYPPFLQAGRTARTVDETRDVAFCGNVYLRSVKESAHWGYEVFRLLCERVTARRCEDLSRSTWEVMNEELERLPRRERAQWGLYKHLANFWDLYLFVCWQAVNTSLRIELLKSIRRPVELFGLFEDPESRDLLRGFGNLTFSGDKDHFRELPQVYASTRINICIGNGLIQQGLPSKLIDCLASGGFALSDPKEDLVRVFGEGIRAIFFRDSAELNEKIEYFLARPKERREITEVLREQVARTCTLEELFARVLRVAGREGAPVAGAVEAAA